MMVIRNPINEYLNVQDEKYSGDFLQGLHKTSR